MQATIVVPPSPGKGIPPLPVPIQTIIATNISTNPVDVSRPVLTMHTGTGASTLCTGWQAGTSEYPYGFGKKNRACSGSHVNADHIIKTGVTCVFSCLQSNLLQCLGAHATLTRRRVLLEERSGLRVHRRLGQSNV